MTLYYYCLDNEHNIKITTLMESLEIKFTKQTVNLFSKKYMFISIDDKKKDFFTKLLIAGVFSNFSIYPFSDIST